MGEKSVPNANANVRVCVFVCVHERKVFRMVRVCVFVCTCVCFCVCACKKSVPNGTCVRAHQKIWITVNPTSRATFLTGRHG